jgi:Arc/MetJ-type ribon-helix-helix transcriptional regulator
MRVTQQYDLGMTPRTAKVAISLPTDQLEVARSAVERGFAPSLSAYIADALRKVERDRSLATLVAELIAEEGSPSEEDFRWADELLGRTQ